MGLTYTDRNLKTVRHSWGRFRAKVSEAVQPGDALSWLNSGADYTVQLANENDSQRADCFACEEGALGEEIWAALAVELGAGTTLATGGVATAIYFAGSTDDLGSPLYLSSTDGKPSSSTGSTYAQIIGRLLARDRILLSVVPAIGTLISTRAILDGNTWVDDGDGYYWGNRIRMDDANAMASGAAKKTLALSIHMERLATNPMTGDSRDYGYYLDYTNRAVNDSSFNVLGFRSQLSNRDSGTVNILRGIEQTVRQRGDGGAITDGIEAGLFSCNLDASGTVPTNFAYGLRVHWRFHGNVPGDAAAFCAHNITDGVYTLGSAYAIRNDGTSGCNGFAFGLDCYDATANPIDTADVRLSTGAYIMTGTGDPNGSVTAPDGSIYIRTGTSNVDTTIYINTDGTTAWSAMTQ